MKVTPAGIGLVVLLGTMVGLMINFNTNPSNYDFYFVVGAIHGFMAMLFAWVVSYAYGFFFPAPPER